MATKICGTNNQPNQAKIPNGTLTANNIVNRGKNVINIRNKMPCTCQKFILISLKFSFIIFFSRLRKKLNKGVIY